MSEKGKRIWLLLEKSERIRDVSLLEEAGKLLWEQVMSPPTSMIDSSSSYSKDVSGDRSSSAQVISSRNFEDFDTSVPNSQGGYSRDAKLSEENMLHENKDGGTANTEENLSTITCQQKIELKMANGTREILFHPQNEKN